MRVISIRSYVMMIKRKGTERNKKKQKTCDNRGLNSLTN
jgi:hypothetical protein